MKMHWHFIPQPTSRKRQDIALPMREHKETGSHEEIQLLQTN